MSDTPEQAAPKFKILVPTSFSLKSKMALEFALTFGYTRGVSTEVYLFHSYDDKRTDFRRLDKVNEEVVARMKQSVLDAIDALQQRGFSHGVDTVHRRLSYGKPWSEILKVAGGIGVDMIIMGSPSSSAYARLIERAPCTLVMVKEKDSTFVMD